MQDQKNDEGKGLQALMLEIEIFVEVAQRIVAKPNSPAL